MRLFPMTKSLLATLAVVIGAAAVTTHAQAPQKTATQAYEEYQVAYKKATKMEDLFPYWNADMVKQAQATPAAQRAQMFEMVKMMSEMYTDIKVVKEDKTSTGATLTLSGVDADKKKATGKVPLTREGGVWKIGKEEWSS